MSEIAQSRPIHCDPMDCNPPGSSVHGILQARKLEWVAISFSRGSSRPIIGKNYDAGRDWGQEEKGMTEDEMAGWYHRLDGHESE